jgi:DNA-binding MarR family transcriptional regulator
MLPGMEPDEFAAAFEDAFRSTYLGAVRRIDDGREKLAAETTSLLGHLAQAGPLTIGEIAEHLGRAPSTVSVKVAQLEDRGLLARQDDDGDGRRRFVWLTPLGRDALAEAHQVLDHDAIIRAATTLDPDERAQLARLLDRLVAGLRPNPTTTPRGDRP